MSCFVVELLVLFCVTRPVTVCSP